MSAPAGGAVPGVGPNADGPSVDGPTEDGAGGVVPAGPDPAAGGGAAPPSAGPAAERETPGAPPRRVVVMGVSGAGKSTVGPLVAARLGVPFADADDFHPPANIRKMSAGQPLDDADRAPWLDAVGAWLANGQGGVVACSALKRAYRDRLRARCPDAVLLHLDGPHALIARRQAARKDHFMPPALLRSQFAALENADPDEWIVRLDVSRPPEALADEAVTALRNLWTNG